MAVRFFQTSFSSFEETLLEQAFSKSKNVPKGLFNGFHTVELVDIGIKVHCVIIESGWKRNRHC